MASHESQAQDLEQIMPLLVHGIEIGADGAEILRADERAKAAGDFLLHLGHTDGALAQIVGKWHTQVCHETQHLGSMFVQTAQQIEGQGLLDPAAALIPPFRPGIAGLSLLQDRLVAHKNPPYLPRAQRRSLILSCRLTAVTRGDQQRDHALRPALAGRFAQERQFAQQVRIAQGMLAVQLPIRFPAVMHQCCHALGQEPVLCNGEHAALGMHPIPGQGFAGHRMQPMQSRGHPQARFIGVRPGALMSAWAMRATSGLNSPPA